MRASPEERSESLGRKFLSVFLAVTLLAAALLSAAPALHERIHPDTAVSHLCVVTLFASGHCAASGSTPIFIAPVAPALPTALPLPAVLAFPSARFFARLEHAPPALT